MARSRRTRPASQGSSPRPAPRDPDASRRRADRSRPGAAASGGPSRQLLLLGLASVAVVAVLAAVVLGGGGGPSEATPGTSASPAASVAGLPAEVDVAGAAELRDAGAFVLDVREPDEWVAGHIPGATLVPLGQLPSRVAEVPADREIVVVCRSGNRSAQGRDILRAAGLDRVTSMAGGMNDWAAAGLPVVTGE